MAISHVCFASEYKSTLFFVFHATFNLDCIQVSVLWTVPKMGFPRGVLPPKVKTWEWSAVTTVRVSDSLVSCAARWMAWSNITASVKASLAMPSWWPWSILPRNRTAQNKWVRLDPKHLTWTPLDLGQLKEHSYFIMLHVVRVTKFTQSVNDHHNHNSPWC